MTKSERIKLIEKVVGALCSARMEISDLTLTEFGLPTQDTWQGSVESYFIAMLGGVENQTLTELAHHLNLVGPSEISDPVADARLWKSGFCRCFFSHTSKHKLVATSIKTAMQPYGCDVFVAHEDISPSLEWLREIEIALSSCHCLVALVTEDFHGSLWTDQEVGVALGRGIPVVPIRAGSDPYGLMGKIQAVPFNPIEEADVAETIFVALNSKNQTAPMIGSGVIESFLESASFQTAKRRMGIVERLAEISPELQQRLREEAPKNRQIEGAFGVTARISSFIEKGKN